MLSEVIDNVLVEGGRQLEVTEALAEVLGLGGDDRDRMALRDRGERLGSKALDPVRGLGPNVNQQTREGSRSRG